MSPFRSLISGAVAATVAAASIGAASAAVVVSSVDNAPTVVSAAPGTIEITWDAATGATAYDVYYDTVSVEQAIDPSVETYEKKETTKDATPSHKLVGLKDNVDYYISVVPVFPADATGFDNLFYSPELKASTASKPAAATGNSFALVGAKAVATSVVELTFSKPVKLPADAAAQFTVTDLTSGALLQVLEARADATTATKVLLALGADISLTGEYDIMAGLQVTDTDGNPIKTGVGDAVTLLGASIDFATLRPAADVLGGTAPTATAPAAVATPAVVATPAATAATTTPDKLATTGPAEWLAAALALAATAAYALRRRQAAA